MAAIAASETDPVKFPQNWDKAVSAAYLRMSGKGQREAAAAAGICERTLRSWEACDWFEHARIEARHRWFNDLGDECRKTVLEKVQGGDADLAMRILERLDPDLAPSR